jgi:hypothetical protein
MEAPGRSASGGLSFRVMPPMNQPLPHAHAPLVSSGACGRGLAVAGQRARVQPKPFPAARRSRPRPFLWPFPRLPQPQLEPQRALSSFRRLAAMVTLGRHHPRRGNCLRLRGWEGPSLLVWHSLQYRLQENLAGRDSRCTFRKPARRDWRRFRRRGGGKEIAKLAMGVAAVRGCRSRGLACEPARQANPRQNCGANLPCSGGKFR